MNRFSADFPLPGGMQVPAFGFFVLSGDFIQRPAILLNKLIEAGHIVLVVHKSIMESVMGLAFPHAVEPAFGVLQAVDLTVEIPVL